MRVGKLLQAKRSHAMCTAARTSVISSTSWRSCAVRGDGVLGGLEESTGGVDDVAAASVASAG
eukprot:5668138-Alexandrium_andersonii.AAC.1